jgi:hypothetical protein
VSTVYILGAGASHGDKLIPIEMIPPPPATPTPTPLVNGFFTQKLYASINYPGGTAERDYPEAFGYIRRTRLLTEAVGEGAWDRLDLEQVFTSIELERSFSNPDSDEVARATLIRNQLVRYIQRILSQCTQYCYGQDTRLFVSTRDVDPDDSVITFNWDLLLDQELLRGHDGIIQPSFQYNNFSVATRGRSIGRGTPVLVGTPGRHGMYLKMHGSLNWHVCGNTKCPGNSELELEINTQLCLSRAMGIGNAYCSRCGNEMLPLLIPPLLHKPIADNWIIRSVWGLARQRLKVASKAVVIGFSAAPTDFYAGWLLRSTLGIRKDVKIYVVNPANDEGAPDYADFKRRMDEIFPTGYNSAFRYFSDIQAVLNAVHD